MCKRLRSILVSLVIAILLLRIGLGWALFMRLLYARPVKAPWCGAYVLHFLTGLLFYPLGYLFAARPVASAVAPRIPWWAVGTIYGAVTWLWAVYVMAYLVAGLPAFFGFSEFTWVALVGHLLFGWVAAAVIRWRLG